ncbi:MAG: hypothetical protein ABH864_04075 [archaeon]
MVEQKTKTDEKKKIEAKPLPVDKEKTKEIEEKMKKEKTLEEKVEEKTPEKVEEKKAEDKPVEKKESKKVTLTKKRGSDSKRSKSSNLQETFNVHL